MADVNLTQQDIDYIARVVDTEVPRSIQRKNPVEYERMVKAVTDTVTNRIASNQFPNTATGVLNQRRQFSKITGPNTPKLSPYGSVQNAPKAPEDLQNMVAGHIADRLQGAPPTIGGAVNYANPNYSDRPNMGWIERMIENGAERLGIGDNIHYHGNAPGMNAAPAYTMDAEGIPSGTIAMPTPRGVAPEAYARAAPVSQVERRALPDIGDMPEFNGTLFGAPEVVNSAPVGAVQRGGMLNAPPPADPARFSSGAPMARTQGQLRGLLSQQAAEQPQSPVDTARFASGNMVGPTDLTGALEAQKAAMGGAPMTEMGPRLGIATETLADQYKSYGVGQAAMRDASLLGLDVAGYDPMGQIRQGLLAQAADPLHAPMSVDARTMRLNAPVAVDQPSYVDPMVTSSPQPVQPAMPFTEQPAQAPIGVRSVAAQPARPALPQGRAPALTGQALAAQVDRGLRSRGLLGAIGGGMLGGAVLGPVGGLLGGLIGKTAARNSYYPPAPDPIQEQKRSGSSFRDLNDRGRDAYRESGQFRDAVDSGRGGLW